MSINLSTHNRAAAINGKRQSIPNAQSLIRRAVVVLSWIITALVTAAVAVGLSLPPWAVYVPFVASVLLFSLPHGAADYLVIPRVLGSASVLFPCCLCA